MCIRDRVATSAAEARSFGLLRPQDQISMNPERLIDDAKALALAIAPDYVAGVPVSYTHLDRKSVV